MPALHHKESPWIFYSPHYLKDFHFFSLGPTVHVWVLSSPMRDQTHALCSERVKS